jgi:radical SAM protein with 4Fe4S-binding SPASM domain
MRSYEKYKRYLKEYLQKNKDYPRSIFVEVTPICNLKCVFCPCYIRGEEVTKDRKAMYMSVKDFKKIIDNIKDEFNFQICFTYSGEPLVHPHLFTMVKYLNQNKIPCVVYSNAMLLTEERIDQMLKAGLDRFIISFDGATKKTYESIRRGAKFEVVINNIKNLINKRNQKRLEKPFVEMQMVVVKNNFHEIGKFKQLSKEVGADSAYLKTLLVYQDTKNKQYIKKVEKYFIENDIARYKKDKSNRLVLKDAKGCSGIQNTVVTSDGNVVICCFDVHGKYYFGNAINESLKIIWDKKEYKEFREKIMNNRKLPICKFCNTTKYIVKRLYSR